MGLITKPNTFSAGALIIAAEHNDNFDTIYNEFNGSIANANIDAAAGIADTKLGNITAAGKVDFTALTASSEAQGTIAYYNGTNWVILAVGTSGQVLKTQGAGANPAWATPGGTPALTLGTANTAGTATTLIRTDDTILVFDATSPADTSTSAATGSAAVAARRDHVHAIGTGSVQEGDLASAAVDQAALKTTTGEVTHQSDTNTILTMSGGEYAFLHNVKMGQTNSDNYTATVFGNLSANFTGFTTYALKGTFKSGGSFTVLAQNRYVTTSGKDHWMFLKVVKVAHDEPQDSGGVVHRPVGDIVSSYQAPDHPSFGSGGDENDIPHPFNDVDTSKYEILLIDNVEVEKIKKRRNHRDSIMTIVHREYEVDPVAKPVYTPREIIDLDIYGDKKGKVIKRIKTPEWAKIVIDADEITLKRRMVNKVHPSMRFCCIRKKTP